MSLSKFPRNCMILRKFWAVGRRWGGRWNNPQDKPMPRNTYFYYKFKNAGSDQLVEFRGCSFISKIVGDKLPIVPEVSCIKIVTTMNSHTVKLIL